MATSNRKHGCPRRNSTYPGGMDSRYADADSCLVWSGSGLRIHVADRSGSITAALSGSEYQAGYHVGVVSNG